MYDTQGNRIVSQVSSGRDYRGNTSPRIITAVPTFPTKERDLK